MRNITRVLIIAILIVALLVGIVGAFNASAATNEPQHYITVKALCPDDAGTKFSVRSWATGAQGANSNVGIQYQYSTQSWVSGYISITNEIGGNFHFADDNDYTIDATIPITDALSVSIVATAIAAWGDGSAAGTMAYATFDLTRCDETTGNSQEIEPTQPFSLLLPLVTR